MYLDIKIGPYKITQRTEFSKIKVFDINKGKDIANESEDFKKIVYDYTDQTSSPEQYFNIANNELIDIKGPAKDAKYLFIPDNIEIISAHAFRGGNFSYINLPNNLKKIDEYAFSDNRELKYINIPDSVTAIGIHAFEYCSNLKKVHLPNEISNIKKGTFQYCKKLENINLPNSIEIIGEDAFFNCNGLVEIQFPEKLEILDIRCFSYCENLSKITFKEELKQMKELCFSSCRSLKEVILPDSVEEIQRAAFYNCTSLEKIKLPNKIKSLLSDTLANCESLTKILLPDTISILGTGVFCKTKIKEINIPKDLRSVNRSPFSESNIKTLIFDNDVNRIDCILDLISNSNVNKIVINNTVKKIAKETFAINRQMIKEIDYLGTEEEFKEFKKHNKELFKMFTRLEKVNFIDNKEKDNVNISKTER